MTYAYVPIGLGSKKPLLPNWNLKENCVTNKTDSHKLEGNNIGIAHAYCEPPTCCLDIDNVELSLPSLKALGFDPEAAETTTFKSGRPNSLKLLFLLEEAPETFQETKFGAVIHEMQQRKRSRPQRHQATS